MNRLKDKVAIVTGGANGIGQAICELFAAEGAWVLVADIEQPAGDYVVETIRSRGGAGQFCRADVSKQQEVQNAVETAASHSGRIDVLCNNAACLSPDFHAALESAEEEWRKCIDVALMGTHYFTLDRSVDEIVQAGAIPLMCIAIRPKALFPKIDQDVVDPTSYKEWETLITAMVNHYKQRGLEGCCRGQ